MRHNVVWDIKNEHGFKKEVKKVETAIEQSEEEEHGMMDLYLKRYLRTAALSRCRI